MIMVEDHLDRKRKPDANTSWATLSDLVARDLLYVPFIYYGLCNTSCGELAGTLARWVHSDSERGNLLLLLHGFLFPNSSKGSFILTIPVGGDSTYHNLCYTISICPP